MEKEKYQYSNKTHFDNVAQLYEDVRPGYPSSLFDDLTLLGILNENSEVLEIGCGTGKATSMIANSCKNLVCLEPLSSLFEIVSTKFKLNDKVKIVQSDFESWNLAGSQFDTVFSAQAFHWIPVSVGIEKAYNCLRDGGSIVLVWNLVDGDTAGADDIAQRIYRKIFHPEARSFRKSLRDVVVEYESHLKSSEYFEYPTSKDIQWERVIDKRTYLRLVSTYSYIQALQEERKKKFLEDLSKELDTISWPSKIKYTCRYVYSRIL